MLDYGQLGIKLIRCEIIIKIVQLLIRENNRLHTGPNKILATMLNQKVDKRFFQASPIE